MPFEKNLRRLIQKLPEHEVPSGLQARIFSQLTEPDRLQKVGFDMKFILVPFAALSAFGVAGGIFFLRSSPFSIALQQQHQVQTGPVTLHFVDADGKPIAKASVMMWGYDKPDPRTGVLPALRVEQMPQGTTDEEGNLTVTPEMHVAHFSASDLEGISRWASGEITVSEGVQTVTVSEHPEHSITGQLVDVKGKPIGGAKPELYVVSSQTMQPLMTGPNGRFIAWIVPGEEYRLALSVPGHAPYFKNGIRVEKGGKVDLGTITLRRTR